jgi:hypothetical protein
MKQLLLVTFAILLLSQTARSETQISLITCDKGDPSYATFGHTAIRVIDSEKKTDLVYNFGIFQFNTPNFVYKFVKGKLNYRLGVHETALFMRMYEHENRTVWEQQLHIDPVITDKIIDTLNYLYLPENRNYLYHFLEKNCTTEARDIIFNMLPDEYKPKIHPTDSTYRDILNQYLTHKKWTQAGINIIMGANIDRPINSYEAMALPTTLMNGITRINNQRRGIIGSTTVIHQGKASTQTFKWWSPLVAFILLALAWIAVRKPIFSYAIWLPIGLIGLLIPALWIISDHVELQYNWNLLWINPLYLAIIIAGIRRKVKLQQKLAGIVGISTLISVALHLTGFQHIHYSLWPLLIVLFLTCVNIYYIHWQKGITS